MHLNLLPQSARLKNQFHHLLRYYFKVWSLAGAGAALLLAAQLWNYYHACQRLQELAVASRPLYLLQEQLVEQRQRIKELKAEYKMLEQLQPVDHSIELLGILVQETRTKPGTIQLKRLSLKKSPPASALSPTAKGKSKPTKDADGTKTFVSTAGTLMLDGVAEDDVALAKFVSGLRDSGVFERVDLKSSTQGLVIDRPTRQYQLECRFEDQP
jgi:Tfp pilus assembly protein PilN